MACPAPQHVQNGLKERLANLWRNAIRNRRSLGLRAYRLLILAAIVGLVREHHLWLRIHGDTPITLEETQTFFPEAAGIRPDPSARGGIYVVDSSGQVLGYAVKTAPLCDHIIGYCGPTDTLVALDPSLKVVGIHIRHSEDTKTHLKDIVREDYFMETWNGMDWKQVATMDLEEAEVEGVSGATMTSMAVAEGIVYRLHHALTQTKQPRPFRFDRDDAALVVLVGISLLFWKVQPSRRHWLRRLFQFTVIVYVGFVAGDLIAQSLLGGWAKAGVPWQAAPGLVLLAGAALLIPWGTRRPWYCHQICPYGAAQELLGRLTLRRFRLTLPQPVDRGLRRLPALLLMIVILTLMLRFPIDLANVEPFDAFILHMSGWIPITIAVVGLVAALFIPQAYCKYGCPTGSLLEFVRSHGARDRFGQRDVVAGLFLVLTLILYGTHDLVYPVLLGP